jgi:hypothetical protein
MANLDTLFFLLYREKYIIYPYFGKIWQTWPRRPLFSLLYTIFELIILLFYIGKKTINAFLFFSL